MTYEEQIGKYYKDGEEIPGKLNISVLKYFWQRSALSGAGKNTIPNFLRGIDVLKEFSDNELRIFSQRLHMRTFSPGEVVFKQDDVGFGFYFIFSGHIDILIRRMDMKDNPQSEDVVSADTVLAASDNQGDQLILVTSLEKGDYFGELALLQEQSLRSAYAVAKVSCTLYGLFKPDLEDLINYHPVIGAKLLQTVSHIVANRHSAITNEIQALKYKIFQMEKVALEKNAKE